MFGKGKRAASFQVDIDDARAVSSRKGRSRRGLVPDASTEIVGERASNAGVVVFSTVVFLAP